MKHAKYMTYKTSLGHLETMYWSVQITTMTLNWEQNPYFLQAQDPIPNSFKHSASCSNSTPFCGEESSLCWETKGIHVCVNILLYLPFQWEGQAYS